ncbi:alanine:cation symporter family protein [Tenacibaculum finnmarkense genomovar finnmarkense]|uniref:Amino acid carrier protein n=1 Tax=Tenacibaculum finnmarkense genomovar finnmarkense TaxID=1458503 RepID=A0AAP1RES7_9FLAO|nr:alanine/glycine:cation symporter family protein [Tenacibaculum finnmarkense]MBE7652256.1 amino acid carrier protein [Tenacibaculum finnmarkense genomovar finnmarkense]MBE7659304.1 amino acid carrier protein [Tenacibaculum finnmarkense genomovar finnmarkense]MBE7691481.1 amino acid carrier protein [Tenacibaculum finnmarkense genomovar finnmarkense]MBE7694572.1 amino acid carrier protein [Tenacibaculum finnmarkense genomovar finnmarkense]MCD8418022.1 alanine:cation symporter family protein [T
MNKRLLTLLLLIIPMFTFAQEKGLAEKINEGFKPVADTWGGFVFYSIELGGGVKMPLVIIMLLMAGLIFTILFKFVNIRLFPTSINIVSGKYDEIDHVTTDVMAGDLTPGGDAIETIRVEGTDGEVSHFQALTAALSGTVGLGNIAGVAVALSLGGPGATFWMVVAGLIGMSSKFVECTLGVKYRDVGEDGTIYGGPMYYLRKGLADVGKSTLGKILAVLFAIMVVGGSFGGGNMFQANQAAQQFGSMIGSNDLSTALTFGVVMSILVGVVIIGGIKRIGNITEKIVPFMVGIYVLAAVIILVAKFSLIGNAFGQIWDGAFNAKGISGGILGVLIIGFQRAAFSNEAGVGSAAIAHSAVRTKYPASEGLVALLEPFIDTVVVCTMTALVIIITNGDGSIMTYGTKSPDGVLATSKAFASVIPWFPYVLTMAVVLFAFSTMLSWSYYGLQGWMFLFGRSKAADYAYKILFCLFVIIGSAASLGAVTDFSDAMIFAMAVPNVIGLFFLYPKVKEELTIYLDAIKAKNL